MFDKLFSDKKQLPQTYRPVLEATEVLDLFSRLILHQQAALLRLVSRNVIYKLEDSNHMGYEFDYNVDGAMIAVTPAMED